MDRNAERVIARGEACGVPRPAQRRLRARAQAERSKIAVDNHRSMWWADL